MHLRSLGHGVVGRIAMTHLRTILYHRHTADSAARKMENRYTHKALLSRTSLPACLMHMARGQVSLETRRACDWSSSAMEPLRLVDVTCRAAACPPTGFTVGWVPWLVACTGEGKVGLYFLGLLSIDVGIYLQR